MTAFAVRVQTVLLPSAYLIRTLLGILHSSFFSQTGGLLSDVFLHLIPHSFMGESTSSGVRFVMVEEKRNILVG